MTQNLKSGFILKNCGVTECTLCKLTVIHARHTTINMVLVVAPTGGAPKAEYANIMPCMDTISSPGVAQQHQSKMVQIATICLT